jgi:hypothetical protein
LALPIQAQLLPRPVSYAQRVTASSIPFQRGGLTGLMTPQGQVLLEPRYPNPIKRYFRAPYLWYTTQAGPLPVVLLSEQGQELGHFKTFTPLPNGLVAATGRRAITLFDSVGHVVRVTPYASIEAWHHDLAVVKLPDSVLTSKPPHGTRYAQRDDAYYLPGLLGLMDGNGQEVLTPAFTEVGPFWQGYAPVATAGRRRGVINRRGQASWLSSAHTDTLSLAYLGGFWLGRTRGRQQVGAVDVHDRVVVPFGKYQEITRRQSDPYIAVMQRARVGAAPNAKWVARWGLLDTTFREITPPLYESLTQHGRWTVVEMPPLGPDQIPQRGALYQGRLVIPARHPQVYTTGDGRYALALEVGRDPVTQQATTQYVCYGPQGRTGMAVVSLQAPAYLGHDIFSY